MVGFDLFKHGLTHLDARYDTLAVDALASQAVEEALRADVVVAFTLTLTLTLTPHRR